MRFVPIVFSHGGFGARMKLNIERIGGLIENSDVSLCCEYRTPPNLFVVSCSKQEEWHARGKPSIVVFGASLYIACLFQSRTYNSAVCA